MRLLMMLFLSVFICILLVSIPADCAAIKAYCNGKEATLDNISINVGENVDIELIVSTDKDAKVYVLMHEPGYIDAYSRVSGESYEELIIKNIRSGEVAGFHWTMTSSGEWSGGKAPLNIAYKILEEGNDRGNDLIFGDFTVLIAYHTGEKYGSDYYSKDFLIAVIILSMTIMFICIRVAL
jgi:sarcinarray family protein